MNVLYCTYNGEPHCVTFIYHMIIDIHTNPRYERYYFYDYATCVQYRKQLVLPSIVHAKPEVQLLEVLS